MSFGCSSCANLLGRFHCGACGANGGGSVCRTYTSVGPNETLLMPLMVPSKTEVSILRQAIADLTERISFASENCDNASGEYIRGILNGEITRENDGAIR